VQTPGCVQGHGALLVLRKSDLTILQTSENSRALLGCAPSELLFRPVSLVLGAARVAQLRLFLYSEPLEGNPLYLFTMKTPADTEPLDVTVHTLGSLVLLEFEATCRDEKREPDYYRLIKRTAARLQAATSVREFCQISAEDVRRVSGLDRVLIYRFHADGSGEVFAEHKRADLPSWLGLHYPAHDIPEQVRRVFMRIWSRPLQNAREELAELVPLANPDTGKPLDMLHCALRGASVMYTEYLQNMGVAASLTLPIRYDDELFGLIACHHYAPTRLTYRVRAACEFLAQMISLQLRHAEEREHLAYCKRMEEVHHAILAHASAQGELAAMMRGTPSILDGISATGAALFHGGRVLIVGVSPPEPILLQLSEFLRGRPELHAGVRPVLATDSLPALYPAAESFANVASGLLAVSLSSRHRSFLVWFRPETVQTVRWGGNPHEMPTVLGPHGPRLTPRRSFELWVESVRLRSLPWHSVEIEAALRLRALVMDLISNQFEQLALLNAELSRSNAELDAFAQVVGHDLKEPLRSIHKYASLLVKQGERKELTGAEDHERIEAILRLTIRMQSLIGSLLHYARVGKLRLEPEWMSLGDVVQEAIEMLGAQEGEKTAEICVPRALPSVYCDRIRLREVLMNLISNAMKYNDKPERWVEIGFVDPDELASPPDGLSKNAAEPAAFIPPKLSRIPDEAIGLRIYYVRDNGIGIEPRHFEQIFRMFKRLHGREAYFGGSGAGLTISRRLIEQCGGLLWVESQPGVGSTFCFTLGVNVEAEPVRPA
jgi:light-regulated signal transduction histidine kinase (bacteriophytochrome)